MHGYKTCINTTPKPDTEIMNFIKIPLSIISRKLQFRYFCFGLKKADTLNAILLWSIIPTAILAYFIMYYGLAATDITNQWYTLFISNATQSFFLSVIVFYGYRHTRHFGIATSVMIYSIYKLMAEVLDLSKKLYFVDTMWKLLIAGLLFFSFYDYYKRCKNENNSTDK